MRPKSILVFWRPVITKFRNIFQKANLWSLRTALPMRAIVVVDVLALPFVLLVGERKAWARR